LKFEQGSASNFDQDQTDLPRNIHLSL
jgi:hypothetical protein